ncbi:MAG TPA: hydantoinase/oxoprolinase family protein, partial [Promineifilum sp.]|nr:hydantoinase/oxoprolinase family protein [Promineifilum sp.]
FLRPEHERRIGALLAERFGPALHVSLSSDILPEYREFERTATTVINAYVAPLMGRYLTRLAERLAPRRLAVMQSNGGVISAALAGAQAARTVLSGPAGGVVGARFVAEAGGAGYADVITFDMGGTSTDVALCAGRAPTTTEGEIAGLPLRLPLIDIHTVGAGGGSLAYLDAGGALLVGPQSAGAEPGPAAYHADYAAWRAALDGHFAAGQATVTDANLVLGRLDARRFLGGQMALHEGSATRAVGALAAALGVPVEQAALAVVRVANATMERAIRRISVERGHDPRRFTLVAFGGGGPLHACELAAELRIPRVLVPLTPGVLSALGMLVAAPARDTSRTVMARLDGLTAGDIAAVFAPLMAQARREMADEGHDPAALALRGALDLRYAGQSHELTVAAPLDADGAAMAAAFHAAHTARYGYARPEAAVELVTARLTATAAHTPPVQPSFAAGPPAAGEALVGRRAVWFAGGPAESALYDRERLRAGHRLAGPAVVYQYDT